MRSPSSPPVLYLTDDDDNETEQNISYGSSSKTVINDNLPRKKRKLTNTNVRINQSIVNWSKRQRNDNYQQQQPTTSKNLINHEPETIGINPDKYIFEEPESHSFHAFDWSTEKRTPARMYSNPIQTPSRAPILPPPNVMNVVKHHLDQSDIGPLIPMTHQNDRYMQQLSRKSISFPISSSSPPILPLPLPTPTSSLIRPTAQRIQPGKNIQIPYTHSTPPPPLPVHHQIKPVFPPIFHSSSSTSILTPTMKPEIRRQALNGTGILSAFYDSKCYRCNICKFKSITSSTLLQHLFTHIFFCHQCSFYTNSNHNLYQHIFEKHNSNLNNDNIDPKNLDLLYLTRCSDGTFALCMDSSTPPPTTTKKPDEQLIIPSATINNQKNKPKVSKKKYPKQKKEEDNDIVLLAEKRNINRQPSLLSSSSSSSSSIIKHPTVKEKQTNTYVLMKHRRYYSVRSPPCLHSLTLEYNICREHTIRHMCHTQRILKRRKFKTRSNVLRLIDEVAKCLKTVVNDIVKMEENSDSPDIVCLLPHNIINLIFPNNNLNTLTNLLKLNNKCNKSIEQNEQNDCEYSVRTSNQHIYILSAPGINKNEQAIFASLQTSITNADSTFTHTKLNTLPISYDNTHRFLKGTFNTLLQPMNSTPKKTNITPLPIKPKNPEPIQTAIVKAPGLMNLSSIPSIVDKNNNSVTSSKSKLSPTPSVIVLD